MHVDRVMLEASRATVMLVASSALVPFRRRDVLAFARVRTGRMPTAMRGS